MRISSDGILILFDVMMDETVFDRIYKIFRINRKEILFILKIL